MTRFLDGPAEGVQLMLRNAPEVLRVVRDRRDGKWDALDAPEDEPTPSEEVFHYRRVGSVGYAHVDYRTRAGRRAGQTVARADYHFIQNRSG